MSHAPTDALERRRQAVRNAAAAHGVSALVVTSLPNVLYLTNFTGSAAIAVVTADRLHFVTDFRYATSVGESRGTAYECPGLELTLVDGSYDTTLAQLLATLPANRIGFEATHLTVSRHRWLTTRLARDAPSIELVPTEGIVERARVRKDDYEIATLRDAARRLSAVARDVVGPMGDVQRGRTERDLALAIDARIHRAGFTKPAFDTIVASGPNAALPHARPGERKLTEGDLVVLDFGGVYDSYCVDLTRTVSVGQASERTREVYRAVREAHDRAIAEVAPGRSRFDIDSAARETLDGYGLGEAFGHGTGHGLGIEVHEDPRISRRRPEDPGDPGDPGDDIKNVEANDVLIAPGMVFTIEPGAYLPGWGGVRIEDDVLVTEHGVEVLTDVTTELIEI